MIRKELKLPPALSVAVDAKLDGGNFNALVRTLLARWVKQPALAKTRKPGMPRCDYCHARPAFRVLLGDDVLFLCASCDDSEIKEVERERVSEN